MDSTLLDGDLTRFFQVHVPEYARFVFVNVCLSVSNMNSAQGLVAAAERTKVNPGPRLGRIWNVAVGGGGVGLLEARPS